MLELGSDWDYTDNGEKVVISYGFCLDDRSVCIYLRIVDSKNREIALEATPSMGEIGAIIYEQLKKIGIDYTVWIDKIERAFEDTDIAYM